MCLLLFEELTQSAHFDIQWQIRKPLRARCRPYFPLIVSANAADVRKSDQNEGLVCEIFCDLLKQYDLIFVWFLPKAAVKNASVMSQLFFLACLLTDMQIEVRNVRKKQRYNANNYYIE